LLRLDHADHFEIRRRTHRVHFSSCVRVRGADLSDADARLRGLRICAE